MSVLSDVAISVALCMQLRRLSHDVERYAILFHLHKYPVLLLNVVLQCISVAQNARSLRGQVQFVTEVRVFPIAHCCANLMSTKALSP